MLNSLMFKLIGGLLVLLFVVGLVVSRNNWKEKAEDRQARIEATCQAVREASANPKLDCRKVDEQIRLTGKALADTKGALARQSAAIDALAAETADAKQQAAKADKAAQERARRPAAVTADLLASSRSSDRLAKPCEPSETVKRNWR